MTSFLSIKKLINAAVFLLTLYLATFGAAFAQHDPRLGRQATDVVSIALLPLFLLEDQDDKALYLLIQFETKLREAGKAQGWMGGLAFIKALIHLKAGRTGEALAILRSPSTSYPEIALYARYLEGELAFAMGDYSRAADFYQAVKKRRSRSPLGKAASFKSALAHQKAGQIDKAIHGYNLYISMDKKGQLSDAAILKLAEAYYEKGMHIKSAKFYRAIWLDRPQSRYYERARIRYEDLAKADEIAIPKLSCDKIGRHAARSFKLQRYEKSKAAYDDFFSRCRNARPSGNWQLNYAVSLYYSRDNDKGVALLGRAIRDDLKGPKSEDSLYWLAKFFYRLKQMPALLWAGDLLLSNFPKGRYADNIVYLKGSIYGENEHVDKAMRQLKELIAEYEGSPYIDRAWWHIGWIHYSKGDHLNASAAFKELTAQDKTSPLAPDALYWLGRSQEKLGLRNEAAIIYKSVASMYPSSYYGMRAAKRLKSLKPGTLSASLDANFAGLSRGSSLCPGLRGDSNLRSLLRRLRAAEMEIGGEGLRGKPLELAFPRCYRKSIEHYAAGDGLDPNLLYAIIMAESKFDKDALSYVGAIGLMQLMPKTARHAASRMNLTPPFEDQLYDPILNLRYGSAYLAELIEIFGGELAPAVASYNAPLQEVILWRTKQGGAASEEFIADIPFYETRKYAQKVLALYEIYNELYPVVGAWQRRPGK